MLYSEEKKDWIMVAWQGKRKSVQNSFYFFNSILTLISNVILLAKKQPPFAV